ncbi:MAG: lipase maturation factor family protein, partial [Candidatus Nanohaloarchaea archaeon]|nr:lipase maturation factor family protein [Candidatus Nanohaloarchaea archaeon]
LFHWLDSDQHVTAAAWLGVGLAALALLGIPSLIGTWATVLVWLGMWLLYLSIVNVGRTFYGFGWESMLLEAGFLAIFLGAAQTAAPAIVIWLFRWLLFRDMFGAGLIKIRGDECWRDLTCMHYHFETQPMPNPLSWFFHHLPDWAKKGGVLFNHLVELIIPFLYFAPQPFAAVAGIVTIVFQSMLIISGNFSWLNWMTLIFAFSLFSDAMITAVLPVSAPATVSMGLPHQIAVIGLAGLIIYLSRKPVMNLISSRQVMNTSFDPFHIVNTYGAFGHITKQRYQLVIEGTRDEEIDDDTEWQEYEFKGQPVRLDRLPPQWAPYHLRLDWQLWFAAMRSPHRSPWFITLLNKLLENDDNTLELLRHNPFEDEPPEHVRAVRYIYEFTSPREYRETGNWWKREQQDIYIHPISEDDPFRSPGVRLRR